MEVTRCSASSPYRFGKNGEDADKVYTSLKRNDYTNEDVEDYFNYMVGDLAKISGFHVGT